MKKMHKIIFWAITFFAFGFFPNSFAQTYPFPANVTYPFGFKATTITAADAQTAYNAWKTTYTEGCSDGSIRVRFDNAAETVSEGIGYGMLMAAYTADSALLNGLWKYYKRFPDANGLMNWKINGCTSATGYNAATDAELDAAMALLVMAKQFPNTTSPYTYLTEATWLINKIKAHEVATTSSNLLVIKPGDVFGGETCTNSSYFAPAYYRAFAKTVTADSVFWNKLATDTYTSLVGNAHATTGLNSDWQAANGTAGGSCGSNYAFSGLRYSYDACRTPWRIGLDYLWWGTPQAKTQLDKMTDWVQNTLGGIQNVKDGYQQDGTLTGQWHNSPFTGAFAVAAMAKDQSRTDTFGSDIKNIPAAADGYFGKTLRVLYLLTLTGNFWNPSTVASPCVSSGCIEATVHRN